jgi:endonuclease/exonuclease/phosphatase family metal-dependent hydrolase
MSMRLLTYNIHKGVGSDRRYRLERIIDVIREQEPDLVCLQEVDRHVKRSHFHDQPSLLARQLGTAAHLYQLNVPHRDGGYGNLILSRWRFRTHSQVSIRQGRRKPRGAQLVVVDTPQGPMHLVNWHLGLREKERRWQARYLLGHSSFLEFAHLPTIIAGDYNDWRNTLGRHHFTDHGFRQATSPIRRFRSFPSFLALAALDKVFYRGGIHIHHATIVRSRLARRASDHLPLRIDFQLAKGAELASEAMVCPAECS